jgi:hypothetical protein
MEFLIMSKTVGLGFSLILLVVILLMIAYPLFYRRQFPEFEVVPGILFLMNVLMMACAAALLVLIYQEMIFRILSSPWFIIPAMVSGPILYLFRSRLPFAYGLLEVVASWTIISLAIELPNTMPASGDPKNWVPILGKIANILGGLYITVRGLDNMDKGIPRLYRGVWNSFFHGSKP